MQGDDDAYFSISLFVCYRLIVGCALWVLKGVGCGLSVVGYGLLVIGCGL